MHVLIVGARGQLGQALVNAYQKQPACQLTLWTRPQHDITQATTATAIAELRPDVVINAAAWTQVDAAEEAPDAAFAANALGPGYLAEGCDRCGAALVQVSSNEVFGGHAPMEYREYDLPAPRSVYARSKLAGELAVQRHLKQLYIVRTAWLFGPGGNHFPSKIVAAADRRGALQVVADERGNPCYAPDVAAAIVALVATARYGIYHLVNEGAVSRFEFAQAVLHATGRAHVPLSPILHTAWQRPADSPLHAVLVNQAAAQLGIRLRPWQEALADYVLTENASVQEVAAA